MQNHNGSDSWVDWIGKQFLNNAAAIGGMALYIYQYVQDHSSPYDPAVLYGAFVPPVSVIIDTIRAKRETLNSVALTHLTAMQQLRDGPDIVRGHVQMGNTNVTQNWEIRQNQVSQAVRFSILTQTGVIVFSGLLLLLFSLRNHKHISESTVEIM